MRYLKSSMRLRLEGHRMTK